MNERIWELASKSGFDVSADGKFGNYSQMYKVKKFAELIVRECAQYTGGKPNYVTEGGSICRHKTSEDDVPLYTSPPQRKPLMEQEIWDAVQHGVVGGIGMPSKAIAIARAIERAHGIVVSTPK